MERKTQNKMKKKIVVLLAAISLVGKSQNHKYNLEMFNYETGISAKFCIKDSAGDFFLEFLQIGELTTRLNNELKPLSVQINWGYDDFSEEVLAEYFFIKSIVISNKNRKFKLEIKQEDLK